MFEISYAPCLFRACALMALHTIRTLVQFSNASHLISSPATSSRQSFELGRQVSGPLPSPIPLALDILAI